MPMINFYQLYPALLSNMEASATDIFLGLYDGYEGVYPFMTANVTTPYTIGISDLSKTGPVVLEIPAGDIYQRDRRGLRRMQPIVEIGSGKPEKLLLLGPGQEQPKGFKGEIIQSDTFLVLTIAPFPSARKRKKLRTAVKAYALSQAAKPPPTRFIKYEPKPGDSIAAFNTQPRDMRFWELVNAYVQNEPMADRTDCFSTPG